MSATQPDLFERLNARAQRLGLPLPPRYFGMHMQPQQFHLSLGEMADALMVQMERLISDMKAGQE